MVHQICVTLSIAYETFYARLHSIIKSCLFFTEADKYISHICILKGEREGLLRKTLVAGH
jgi:hypothetical protein